MGQSDRDSKRFFIETYFEDLDDKVRFLETLYRQNRRDEALMLCCVYVDGFGNWLSGTPTGSAENFCRTLIDRGGEDVLSLILPGRLAEKLPWKSGPAGAHRALKPALLAIPKFEALTEAEFLAALGASVPAPFLKWLERHVWRGSIASVVFERLRSLNVHQLGSAGGLAFGQTTHGAQPIPDIDFFTLYRALKRIAAHARDTSLATNKWFGIM